MNEIKFVKANEDAFSYETWTTVSNIITSNTGVMDKDEISKLGSFRQVANSSIFSNFFQCDFLKM